MNGIIMNDTVGSAALVAVHTDGEMVERLALVAPDGRDAGSSARYPAGKPCRVKVDPETQLSDSNDLDQVLDPGQIPSIAGVEPSRVGMCCGCDEQIHDPRSGLPAGVSDGGRELAVAGGHIVVDR